MASPPFRFKRFDIRQEAVVHPAGTDSVLLGAWAPVAASSRILDVGTGTGIVALMLAQRTEAFENVSITGVELDDATAACAAANFAASPWSARLVVVNESVQQFADDATEPYDLIVSNPPFFTETVVSPDSRRRLGRNTDSLRPGEFLAAAEKLLRKDGKLAVILPPAEGRRLCEMAVPLGLYCTMETCVRTRKDKSVERFLLVFERRPQGFERTELSIYEAGEVYSAEFQEITRDFYLFF